MKITIPSIVSPSVPALALLGALLAASCGVEATETATQPQDAAASTSQESDVKPDLPDTSVYALSTKALDGEDVVLAKYAGKVTVFVNVASKCGYTKQYAGLQKLYEEMGGEEFTIVGVPSNDFGGQEPGTAAEIQTFCSENYGVTFDLLEKQGTKDGDSVLFDRLASLAGGSRPGWNFCKYVVSKDGTQAEFLESKATPDGAELKGAIERLSAL